MFNLIIRFNNFFYSFLCRTKKIFIFVSDYGRYLLSNGLFLCPAPDNRKSIRTVYIDVWRGCQTQKTPCNNFGSV